MKNQGTYIFLGLILLGLFSFLIFKPSATANAIADSTTVKCEDKLSISDSNLQTAQAELASCNQLKAAAITDMNKMQNPSQPVCDTTDLTQKIADLTKQRTSIMTSLKTAQDAAKECTGDANIVDELNSTIIELGRNSANNICCKMRVDNPNIKAYNLDGNKVNCIESGDLLLSCP